MKELEHIDRLSEKQQIEQQVKDKKKVEYRLEDTIQPHNGHKVFEIHTPTGRVKEAEYIEKQNLSWEDAQKLALGHYKKNIAMKVDCVYISALNKTSALKRWKQNKGSAIREKGNDKLSFY